MLLLTRAAQSVAEVEHTLCRKVGAKGWGGGGLEAFSEVSSDPIHQIKGSCNRRSVISSQTDHDACHVVDLHRVGCVQA